MTLNLVLEWSGAVTGLVGAAILASQTRHARWGWLAFLLANLLLISWALRMQAMGLLVQQVGFTVTSLLGLYRSGLWPRIRR